MRERYDPDGNLLPRCIYWFEDRGHGYAVRVTRRPKVHYIGVFPTLDEARLALVRWWNANADKLPRYTVGQTSERSWRKWRARQDVREKQRTVG